MHNGERLAINRQSALKAKSNQRANLSAGNRLKAAVRAQKWRIAFLVFAVLFAYFITLNIGYMATQWDEMAHLLGGELLVRGQIHSYMYTEGYYPPLFDLFTTGYMHVFGVTPMAGRLVSATFAVLAVWAVFEFTNRIYGPRNALLAGILLATTPGFVWVSRVSMLESILIFFFTVLMFMFYSWITKNSNKALILSGLVFGIGVLAKYQMVVAALAMALSVLFLCRNRLKISLAKVLVIILIAVLIVLPWLFIVYQVNGQTKFQQVTSALEYGSQNTLPYSNRFFFPVFYLVELTWPAGNAPVNPVSLPIMILGLAGLGLFAYRRKKQDIFLLTWFLSVYVFFTFVPNRQWRYVDPVFPILAISAACFLIFLYGEICRWHPNFTWYNSVSIKKLVAALFIFLVIATVLFSANNSYQMTARDQVSVPIQQTTAYLVGHLGANQSAVILCAFNLLNDDMFHFYLPANMSENQIWQYPSMAVDAYTPIFNITEFVNLCVERNVKYVILYDYGTNMPFYDSTLTYGGIMQQIYATHRFGVPTDQPFFGDMPNRLFLVRFNQTATGT
jgi:4-amino-4-deoxy-L-arabinose transferase-like glycosyltransferase